MWCDIEDIGQKKEFQQKKREEEKMKTNKNARCDALCALVDFFLYFLSVSLFLLTVSKIH